MVMLFKSLSLSLSVEQEPFFFDLSHLLIWFDRSSNKLENFFEN